MSPFATARFRVWLIDLRPLRRALSGFEVVQMPRLLTGSCSATRVGLERRGRSLRHLLGPTPTPRIQIPQWLLRGRLPGAWVQFPPWSNTLAPSPREGRIGTAAKFRLPTRHCFRNRGRCRGIRHRRWGEEEAFLLSGIGASGLPASWLQVSWVRVPLLGSRRTLISPWWW